MEYIYTESIPDNLNMYIDEFHTSMKAEFEKSISKIYSNEISVYKDVVETIVKLPFIQKIINENKVLKAKIVDLENMNNGVKLEITDKPISKNILDIEKIPFYKDSEEEDEEDEENENEEEDEDEEDEEKEDEEVTDTESKMYFDTKMESKKDLLYNEKYKHVYGDDGETVWSVERNQYGVNNDNQDSSSPLLAYKEAYVVTRQENVAETKEEEESSVDEEEEDEDEEDEVEEEEEDEEEEDEVEEEEEDEEEEDEDEEDEDEECEDEECEDEEDEDEEDENEEETLNNMPTFPSKVSNKLEKEPSADEEEPSADEEEPSADEEEPSADEEQPSADEEEPSADEEQPSADEEEPSADEEETNEVFEIEIDDVTYYCDDEENGNIYEDKNGEVGDIVGKIKDGEASFFE